MKIRELIRKHADKLEWRADLNERYALLFPKETFTYQTTMLGVSGLRFKESLWRLLISRKSLESD